MSIPSNNRLPFTFIDFDPSRAARGPSKLPYQGILMGQKLAAGSKASNGIYLVRNPDEAGTFFGLGSQLHRMFKAWFATNKTTKVYGLPLDDDGSGVVATGTLAFAGPATAAGVVYLYINGARITVSVSVGDTASVVAAAINAAINALTDLAVTSTVTTSTVTVNARNKGVAGNDIDLRFNYNDGEAFPTGITCTITAMASGAVNPVLTGALLALGDVWYNFMVAPYLDATSMSAIEAELDSRFSSSRAIRMHYFSARRGNLSSQITYGNGRNSPHVTVWDMEGYPSSPAHVAASCAGAMISEIEIDPARPVHTLPVTGVLPPAISVRRNYADLNTLLFDGISPLSIDQAGTVRLSTVITMYQKNGALAADTAYLYYNTMAVLDYLRYSFKNHLALRYSRAKLANDDTPIKAGDVVMTPKVGKSEAVAWFMQMLNDGLVEGLDQFKTDLVVARDSSDVSRMNFNMSPDLINALITNGITFSFLN